MVFSRRILSTSTHHAGPNGKGVEWKKILYMLYYTSVLIMIRSIFRPVEYIMGNDGYLLRHEWTMYVFDVVLMIGVMVVFYVWYPSSLKINDKGAGQQRGSMEAGLVHRGESQSTGFVELMPSENKR